MRFAVSPCTIDEANCFVEEHHRHRARVVSGKFALAAIDTRNGNVCGVAIVGRPVARILDDGLTLEITRLATDGTKNSCSFLYSASWRATRELGYRRLITYTLKSESGISLTAAGWKSVAEVRAKSWHTPSRPRIDRSPLQQKIRWEMSL